jgi:hypothetical protein
VPSPPHADSIQVVHAFRFGSDGRQGEFNVRRLARAEGGSPPFSGLLLEFLAIEPLLMR